MKQKIEKEKLILLTGGGTIGSVTPLLAIVEILRSQKIATGFLWLGTANGPERQLVTEAGIPFQAISGGKLRRYLSFQNIQDSWRVMLGFFQAYQYLKDYRPKLVLTAGSFVSVPVVWAAKILGIPVIIEQLDYRAGLANRLMAPVAKQILVTFAKSSQDYGRKAVWLGAPVNPNLLQLIITDSFDWPWSKAERRPTVLIIGGGTGAAAINDFVNRQLSGLIKIANIIHLTGRGKAVATAQEHYCPVEFFNQSQMKMAYAAADLVVARAGLGTLIELAALKKISIIIPIPNSHQVDNAQAVAPAVAAIVDQEKELANGGLVKLISRVLSDSKKQAEVVSNWPRVIKIANENEIATIFKRYL